ncbi:MAG: benzoate-CoA ligase family protein [Candidatus Rokubacteria bacterium]|nr:benzoate-CoA ligase family protein [Candidatus Rokubacteria bacterium]
MTVAVHVPERFNAAAFFVDRHPAEGRGGRTVFRYRGRRITYAELAERVNRFGNALLDLGVEIENRILLILPDCPEFAEAFWGTIKIGAVPVPVNPWLKGPDYAFLLEDSRAKVAVVGAETVGEMATLRDRCRFLRHVVVAGERPAKALGYEELLARAAPSLDAADTSRDDVALWGYTSGSTGKPKAAVHLQQDLVSAADLVGGQIFGIGPDDLIFSASKLFFVYGLGNSLYFPARVGAASVLVPERIEPERAFEVIATERPTVFFTVATLYARMLQVEEAERRYDLSSLRLCVSSGEALPTAIFHAWKSRFGHELLDVVGSTEALHDFIANRPGEVRPGSSGKVIPGFEARLVDDRGNPVMPGNVGHLLIKAPTAAPYYWKRPAQTRAAMLGEWLRTGDMFYEDTDGYFYFCGRSDDMLKVGGMWVSPIEVEGAILEHPAVVEAGVIGSPDADGLTKPRAFVVLKPGSAPSDELAGEIREFVKKRLAGYKAPRWVEFVSDLPKTATGKVQRFRLRS